jgi:hypothetical protein
MLAGLSDFLIPEHRPLPLLFYSLWAGILLLPGFVSDRRVHASVLAASFIVPLVFGAIVGADL